MIRAVVTDIEGTTSAIRFVTEGLFPYAREALPEFVRQHRHEPEVATQLAAVRARHGGGDLESLIEVLLRWMDEDRKHAPLKNLQGMVWAQGYAAGELRTHVYADAARALRRWHNRGLRLFVYSSASVQAQRLLFTHTDAGDLSPCFEGWFDTRVGGKREAAAYAAIVRHIGVQPAHIAFLSDVVEELNAARQAGLRTWWLMRERRPPLTQTRHPVVTGFDALPFD